MAFVEGSTAAAAVAVVDVAPVVVVVVALPLENAENSPSSPRFWTIHRDVREDVEKFLRINCLVLRSNSLSKGTANLVKHRERREKSNLIHGLRMEDGDFLF